MSFDFVSEPLFRSHIWPNTIWGVIHVEKERKATLFA